MFVSVGGGVEITNSRSIEQLHNSIVPAIHLNGLPTHTVGGCNVHVYMYAIELSSPSFPQLPDVTPELNDVQNALNGIDIPSSIQQVCIYNVICIHYYTICKNLRFEKKKKGTSTVPE